MKRILLTLAASVTLGGCAGSEMHATNMERFGDMHVFEADRPDHDYRFYVKNVADVGFDVDRREDRYLAVQKYLAQECQGITVVDETFLPLGRWLSGGKRGQYLMRVKCNR